GGEEVVNDLVLLDGKGEEVDLLDGANLALANETAELGNGNPFLVVVLTSAASTATTATAATTVSTASTSETAASAATIGRCRVSHCYLETEGGKRGRCLVMEGIKIGSRAGAHLARKGTHIILLLKFGVVTLLGGECIWQEGGTPGVMVEGVGVLERLRGGRGARAGRGVPPSLTGPACVWQWVGCEKTLQNREKRDAHAECRDEKVVWFPPSREFVPPVGEAIRMERSAARPAKVGPLLEATGALKSDPTHIVLGAPHTSCLGQGRVGVTLVVDAIDHALRKSTKRPRNNLNSSM
ncbi:hypothetical protein BJ684DRAFT_16907, partial [Piptocephalis cylindrospora]